VRFTGQVRVPEVDHPGIPAMIVVEDGQAEVLLEGESLGRWSLYDVHAARLVSSAFSISFDGEEITFIADEPVDFAYKGVEHMAGVWARYKAMTIPRRLVAVGRSRRGTVPSRIPELREAMLQNLKTVERVPASISAPEAAITAGESSPWAKRLDAYSAVPEPVDLVEASPEPVDLVEAVPEPVDLEVEAATTEPADELLATDPPAQPAADAPAQVESQIPQPLRPGPGLIPRPARDRSQAGSSTGAEPSDWDLVWEEPSLDEDPSYEEPPADAAELFAVDSTAVEEEQMDEAVAEPEPPAPTTEPEPPEPSTESVAEAREVVVDLGNLEETSPEPLPSEPPAPPRDPVLPDEASLIEPDLELLFAGTPASQGERSGLLGAVRSAFTRSRSGVHEHQFVEAPGGIGIVRQICAECGYISIGISD
jgi:hypothetical protein